MGQRSIIKFSISFDLLLRKLVCTDLTLRWLTINMGDKPLEQAKENILKTKYSIVTIHDVSSQYTQKILHIAGELENNNVFIM
jgi:uncharacterized SAM-dependent methyltransferase